MPIHINPLADLPVGGPRSTRLFGNYTKFPKNIFIFVRINSNLNIFLRLWPCGENLGFPPQKNLLPHGWSTQKKYFEFTSNSRVQGGYMPILVSIRQVVRAPNLNKQTDKQTPFFYNLIPFLVVVLGLILLRSPALRFVAVTLLLLLGKATAQTCSSTPGATSPSGKKYYRMVRQINK